MYDTLLFLHVLAAFVLAASVVTLGSVALGAPAGRQVVSVGNVLWDVGAAGTLVFGVWLAIHEDAYDLLDGWILGALVLWVAASGVAVVARRELSPEGAWSALGLRMHWLRTAFVVAFLVLMIWKPGA